MFLLGPAHHTYLDGCALTACSEYETPFGNITIDTETTKALHDTGEFEYFSKHNDEEEHSLEMHLPYIKRMFGDHDFTLVPIVIGSIRYKDEQKFGKILSEYVKDEETLFVISSDFCHWGMHFQYMPYDNDISPKISGYIEHLDKQGMDLIETQNGKDFSDYLKKTENTICGRHPITVFLEAIKESGLSAVTKFVKYAQSGEVTSKRDSSVSYAASYTTVEY